MGNRLMEARQILAELGMPPEQSNKVAGLTLMALARVSDLVPWSDATKASYTIRKGIMDYVGDVLGHPYKENSRETFRRKVLHQFVQGGICLYNPDAVELATNSSLNHYALSPEALATIKTFGTPAWDGAKAKFLSEVGSLVEQYAGQRKLAMVPVTLLDGTTVELSSGKHNELQRDIVEQFAPRFAPGAKLLYMGDTRDKALVFEEDALRDLGFPMTSHDKLPDVILYRPENKWLYLVEAVTTHGPVSPKRMLELRALLERCEVGPVFVSAFLNMKEFKKWATDIAWETEVWLADMPDHMLHFNGDRFLGPR